MDALTIIFTAMMAFAFPVMGFKIFCGLIKVFFNLFGGLAYLLGAALCFVFGSFKLKEMAPKKKATEASLLINLARLAPKTMARTVGEIVKDREAQLRNLQKQNSQEIYKMMGNGVFGSKKNYH